MAANRLLTPQVNTLPNAVPYPGNLEIEARIEGVNLYNAVAMVYSAENLQNEAYHLGGHTATPASASSIFHVGMLHHWRDKDHIFFQGHSSPWVYAFYYQIGKTSLTDLQHFRRLGGLPSYPHPFLRPDLWENATVSMGLGPLFGIFQAKFERYLQTTLAEADHDIRTWVTIGDGECEEPEVLGCARVASRYNLDKLCFIVLVNHQSLDGPVYANGSLTRDLESSFNGMGWNVIKLLWGEKWDRVLADDRSGEIVEWLGRINDGSLLASIGLPADRAREILVESTGGLPKVLQALSASELQILMRDRGGHCLPKIHQAMAAARATRGQPTVILAQTIKGYRIPGGEARYPNHKLVPKREVMLEMAREFGIEINPQELTPRQPEEALRNPFYKFAQSSPEQSYIESRRRELADGVRLTIPELPSIPPPTVETLRQAVVYSKEQSTTQVFNSITRAVMRSKDLREYLVPIMVDEARTFGFDAFFPMGIWNPDGQNYFSAESEYNKVTYYREHEKGRIIQESINEVGATATFTAVGRAWHSHKIPLIPVLMFYSQFFSRMFDAVWAGGDMLARGFLLGCTAGTTTLNGEGLQHADRHTPTMADKIPSIRVYEMAYADSIAILTADAFQRMLTTEPNAIYYIRLFNEKWLHHPVPKGWEEGVIKGGYPVAHWRDLDPQRYLLHPKDRKAMLWASGPTLPLALEAQRILAEKYNVLANVFDITSYHMLARDAAKQKREAMLHPELPKGKRLRPFLYDLIPTGEEELPIIASMDASGAIPVMVAGYLKNSFDILTPSGWGRSGTREELRDFFEISPRFMIARVLLQLGLLTQKILQDLDIESKNVYPGATWPAGSDRLMPPKRKI